MGNQEEVYSHSAHHLSALTLPDDYHHPMNNLFHCSDQTWLAIDQIGILAGNVMFLVALGGGVLAVVKRNAIRRKLARVSRQRG